MPHAGRAGGRAALVLWSLTPAGKCSSLHRLFDLERSADGLEDLLFSFSDPGDAESLW